MRIFVFMCLKYINTYAERQSYTQEIHRVSSCMTFLFDGSGYVSLFLLSPLPSSSLAATQLFVFDSVCHSHPVFRPPCFLFHSGSVFLSVSFNSSRCYRSTLEVITGACLCFTPIIVVMQLNLAWMDKSLQFVCARMCVCVWVLLWSMCVLTFRYLTTTIWHSGIANIKLHALTKVF